MNIEDISRETTDKQKVCSFEYYLNTLCPIKALGDSRSKGGG